ncbi:MAG TPA: hypothetical protein EYQ59_05480 [Planctomycetes bacterium]|nr:hypothetical protein [Planctomycetota bacterium]
MTQRRVLGTWWPLAASWLLMGVELPMLSAIIARLADPEQNLAAFGGIVFPVSLLIEAPIIMMLAASTALSRDRDSFERLRRFAVGSGLLLSGIHALVAFTPLFDLLVVGLIDPPSEIIEPARLGMRIMTPWTVMISDRRFHQGVLIRSGHSRAVGIATLVRFVATMSLLFVGFQSGWIGCAVACAALTGGVTVEMLFVRRVVAPVVASDLGVPLPGAAPLDLRRLLAFYIPLALTPLLNLTAQPMGSAAMSRMPQSLNSLAAWPVAFGLIFVLRSVGIAFNEVVVRHAGEPDARRVLGRFTWMLALACVALLALVAATPLADFWFGRVVGLSEELTSLAGTSLWLGLLLPAMTVYHSFYQGLLVHSHQTRGVTESVALFLVITILFLWAGEALGHWPGIWVSLVAFSAGSSVQAAWLARCVRRAGL